MRPLRLTAALASAAVCAISAPVAAMEGEAGADAPGDYLPSDILVVGQRDGYATDDGSSGTKTPTPLIDVPQTIAVITENQLDDQGITQLGDALRYVPGVSLDTGEGHRDQVFIRGQASTADFYLDGLRDDAEYYRPLYNIARVEVLKGANALIFGRGGGGGVINRVSKVADFTQPALAFDANVDSFGAFSLGADLNQPLSASMAARLNATYEEFDNARDFYEGRFIGVSPTVTVNLGERTHVSAFYTYDDDRRVTDRGVPSLNGAPLTGFDRTFFGDAAFNESESVAHIARLRFDHEFTDGLVVNFTGQFADHDKFYANVVPASATATTATLNGYTSGTDRQNRILQGNLVWQAAFGAIESTFLAGFEIGGQETDADRYNIAFANNAASVTVPLARVLSIPAARQTTIQRGSSSQLDTISGYIQEQLDFGPVQLVAGLRYDEFDLDTVNLVSGFAAGRTDRKWSPRVGLVVKPQESLSLYAGYATSFLPQSGDQFSVLDATTASLAPEKFENLEAGVKWSVNPSLFATAAVFRLDRSNTRAVDPANPGLTVLTGESRVEGFEASLVGRLRPEWQVSLGYTYLDGEIRSATTSAPAGRRLQQLPRHQASAWTRYDLSDRFGLGLGAVYQGKQFASVSNAVTLPDWVRVDAAAFLDLSERFALQLNVENLFDRDYYSSAHGDNNIQPGEPFSVRLGLKVKL
ncbi:putative TonB-dependent receptor BfrD precursor [Tsuneonella dongtanensis]|uniref:Putative TonB-dependent receptor BfrD n=1 Tax=Tsuneonella dongtanensis TaxID=692370 RepID=A0A1B2ABF0_9SPHN|nr:TonB-dependent siderophore receptor [Tsuneonella dongtanensis]ANY19479.1 putative TonB-dependent receptor BfrD precursor [Tsuneonella dongtanensis]